MQLDSQARVGIEGLEESHLDFRSEGPFCIEAVIGGKRVAEVVARPLLDERALRVELLLVERGYRGQGVGSRLLTHIERVATAANLEKVVLRAFSLDENHMDDGELVSWYERRGYVMKRGFMMKKLQAGGSS